MVRVLGRWGVAVGSLGGGSQRVGSRGGGNLGW